MNEVMNIQFPDTEGILHWFLNTGTHDWLGTLYNAFTDAKQQ